MVRLQKYLSICGVASRRKSEELIKSGLVKVNGETVVKMGFCVNKDDKVEYAGKILTPNDFVYIVLDKPEKVICSRADYSNRKTVYDIVKDSRKIFSIGRLDYDSCGLLILTNDGDFANGIMHPSKGIVKTYRVTSFDSVGEDFIRSFKNGVKIEGISYKALDIVRISENELKIFLNEGKKREIREVYKKFGIKITELKRVAVGKLRLENLGLAPGKYKYFTKEELERFLYG